VALSKLLYAPFSDDHGKGRPAGQERRLEHDAKKWEPVFRKIMRPNKNLEPFPTDMNRFGIPKVGEC
jgi:hypothetical protein